jgi:yecA family protein
MLNITFAEVEHELHTVDANLTVAEAHGCLCGALCTLQNFSPQRWLQELLPEEVTPLADPPANAVSAVLQQLFTDSSQALCGDAMEFTPLLPDDEAPLAERIAALAQWSQGFLYGFGIGAPTTPESLPGDTAEVLRDLSEIARANDAEVAGSDEEEQAYAELVEYLRAAVQMLHEEFAAQRDNQSRAHSLPH